MKTARIRKFVRDVKPEWLDCLAPDDPRAVASRRDLRRINWLMATRLAMSQSLNQVLLGSGPVNLVELGAGDGRMMLPIARRHARHWPKVSLDLVDLQPVVSEKTLRDYKAIGWNTRVVRADVFDWLAESDSNKASAVIIANLFMHHFEGRRLRELIDGIAARSQAFICCEPRRTRLALLFSQLLGAIGCNDVTRHDAVASVHAGFRNHELTQLWPKTKSWRLQEGSSGLFVHRFQASRDSASRRDLDR